MRYQEARQLMLPKPLNRQLWDLKPCDCRWPVNAPAKGANGWRFCGHPRLDPESPRAPYCAYHVAVAKGWVSS